MTLAGRIDRLSLATRALTRSVLDSSVVTSVDARRAAYDGSGPNDAVLDYIKLVDSHADQVTDARWAALLQTGLSQDAIFELTVAAAMGAAQRRLDAGLALLNDSVGS